MMRLKHFYKITESPGQKATREQIERLYHRYRFARDFAVGKRVLEVACGSGLGLAYLAECASEVIGGDIDERNLAHALKNIEGKKNVRVFKFDAHNLPFQNESFELVLLYEAIYYLEQPDIFLREAKRVLAKDGCLVICMVNKDWKDFHPSKYSTKYFSVPELKLLIDKYLSDVKLYGAFEVKENGMREKVNSLLKRFASKIGIIPGSLKARVIVKRLFIGKLVEIPKNLNDLVAEYTKPMEIKDYAPTGKYKIIYAVAKKRE